MMKWLALGLVLWANMSYGLEIKPITITAQQQQALLKGKIILQQMKNPEAKKSGKAYAAVGAVKASIHEVYQAIIDFKNYPQFMPNMDKFTVTKRTKDSVTADVTLGLPLKKYKKYRLQLTFAESSQQATLAWHQLPWPGLKPIETIVETQGYWLLTIHPKQPDYVVVNYHVYSDPGHIPLGLGWIANWLTKKSLPDVMEKTRQRIYQQQKAKQ